MDPRVQRAVLHRPGGESVDLPRLGGRTSSARSSTAGASSSAAPACSWRDLLHLLRRGTLALPPPSGPRAVPRVLRRDVLRHGRDLHVPRAEGRVLSLGAGVAAVGIRDLGGSRGTCLHERGGAGGHSCDGLRRIGSSPWPASRARSHCRPFSSAILFVQWDRSRIRHEQARDSTCATNADPGDVFMASDPATIHPLTGLSGPRRAIRPVRRDRGGRRRLRCGLGRRSFRPGPGETDPLNLWDGAQPASTARATSRASCRPTAFEGDDVRVFRVER